MACVLSDIHFNNSAFSDLGSDDFIEKEILAKGDVVYPRVIKITQNTGTVLNREFLKTILRFIANQSSKPWTISYDISELTGFNKNEFECAVNQVIPSKRPSLITTVSNKFHKDSWLDGYPVARINIKKSDEIDKTVILGIIPREGWSNKNYYCVYKGSIPYIIGYAGNAKREPKDVIVDAKLLLSGVTPPSKASLSVFASYNMEDYLTDTILLMKNCRPIIYSIK